MFPTQLVGDRLASEAAEGGVVRQGKSRRISITIFIISIGSRIYGNRGSGVAVASSSFQRNGRGRTPAAVSLKPTRPAQRADGNQNRLVRLGAILELLRFLP